MIYLDNGATSFCKPASVRKAVNEALIRYANPGRGGYEAAMEATRQMFACRQRAAGMFDCRPEQVVFTGNCTHGLNIGIHTLVKPGSRVVISGFEHNAVTRPLHACNAQLRIAGRKLFDWEDTLSHFEDGLKQGADAAVFTHVSNVFGYILPVDEMAALCRQYGIPFILDAAQSAGHIPISLEKLGADFIAMPGHKGLLGPQGTGLLLCAGEVSPFLYGGTGNLSLQQTMPEELPERLEAGTLNVPGIAGLNAGLAWLETMGVEKIGENEKKQAKKCAIGLKKLGFQVFEGEHQSGTLSFLPGEDCEEFAQKLGHHGIAVRAGLHCAPLAHESAGTLESGTVRVSFGYDANDFQTDRFLRAISKESGAKR